MKETETFNWGIMCVLKVHVFVRRRQRYWHIHTGKNCIRRNKTNISKMQQSQLFSFLLMTEDSWVRSNLSKTRESEKISLILTVSEENQYYQNHHEDLPSERSY
jgi:hypothetical protein